MARAVCEGSPSCINLILIWFYRWGMQTGELDSEKYQLFRFVFLSFFATFKITPRRIKMLCLHILLANSTENWNAFCKLIVLKNYKISKKSNKSVLRYIENITGSVGNFVKCIFFHWLSLTGDKSTEYWQHT